MVTLINIFWPINIKDRFCIFFTICRTWLVRLSVRPSVCRRHGFRSISQVCFGISISNFICMLMVAIGRSLLIFSNVTFKMAAWRPYWIFWFPDSNFTLALNINFEYQTSAAQYLCIWVVAYWFSATSFSKWPPGGHIRFLRFLDSVGDKVSGM